VGISDGVTLRETLAVPGSRSKPRKHEKKSLSEEKLLELGGSIFPKIFQIPGVGAVLRRVN